MRKALYILLLPLYCLIFVICFSLVVIYVAFYKIGDFIEMIANYLATLGGKIYVLKYKRKVVKK